MPRTWPETDAVTLVARAERAKVLAAVARDVRDLELAEDAVQEALLAAARAWPEQGVPARPGAWLTTVARRAAWKELRRRSPLVLDPELQSQPADEKDAFPDAQLELLFACCHPALRVPDQVALTLRTVGGLTTQEIARAFFVEEATIAQRLVRAQRRIRDSRIPFSVPSPSASLTASPVSSASSISSSPRATTRAPRASRSASTSVTRRSDWPARRRSAPLRARGERPRCARPGSRRPPRGTSARWR